MRRLNADLEREVATLGDLPREQLAVLWQKAHGHPPPKGIRQELLVRSASWHLQENRLGGLSPITRRLLKAAIADIRKGRSAKTPASTSVGQFDAAAIPWEIDGSGATSSVASSKRVRQSLVPGARLIRDWNGKTHVVDVIEEGFVFQAKVHKSLTAIAHHIAGAHWSGPRFFGL